MKEQLCVDLELNQVLDRNVGDLSGGELQSLVRMGLSPSLSLCINIFLAGFIPTENLRFRDGSLTFKVAETPQENAEEIELLVYLKPDNVERSDVEIADFILSYKSQKISPKFQSTVRNLLHSRIRDSYMHPQFVSDVMRPLLIEQLKDQEVLNLSGGELQRVALRLCLGKPADIYLIDEPSAYLDSEQRILHAKKTAFVVEHDFIMATYVADRVIVYEGTPSLDCTANSSVIADRNESIFICQIIQMLIRVKIY
ncbi:hypothetical protein K2173_009786 [Erythroxylum novogranatense]|uniref:ABC transporter domain-containing protein n=1 Tax=Erythroxylum novogranatense TaxID=1862640 RepID=A0AAV8SZF2_9ROSI|nr:hypothetical protein K2173_009786 [Erythroxylum novogranatense]